MKHEPEPEPGPGSTEFFSFAFHLIEALLVGNDHPGRMNRRMAEKLRELTGARLVVVARSRAGKKDGCSHEIAAVEPERRRPLAESPAIMALAELTCNLRSPVLWEKGNGPPEAEAIMGGQELPGPILAAPLLLGEEHVGAVLLFSLPDKYSLDQVIDALGTLARVLAPVLRNAALYADQEAIIAARSKKLLESEERTRLIYDTVGDSLFLLAAEPDGVFRIVSVNAAFLEITGLNEIQVIGKRIDEVIPEPSQSLLLNKFQQAIKEGRKVQWEQEYPFPAGKLSGQITVTPAENEKGVITHLVGSINDVSERKKAEEALRESEDSYRRLVEFAPVAIAIHSAGQLVFVNPAAVQLMRAKSADELIGKPVLSFVHPDSQELAQERIKHALATGEAIPLAMEKFIRLDGSTVNVETYARPILYEGRPAVQVIVRDIEKRIRAEQALEQRVVQLTLLNDISGKITAVQDIDDLMADAVRQAHVSFGYHHVALFILDEEHQNVVMQTRAGLFDHLFPAHHQLKVGQGLVGWAAQHNETVLANDTDPEDRYVNFNTEVIPTRSEIALPICIGEKVVGVFDVQSPALNAFDEGDVMVLESLANQIAVGIENARLLEAAQNYASLLETRVADRTRELTEAQEKLIRKERLAVLGELAGGVGHELRNPLGVITNAIYYLKMVLPESDIKIQEYLRLIDAEARNAAGIIAQLFDFARVQPPNRIPVEVSVLVAEVIAQHPLPENVTFSEELPGDLPPIYVDPDQVNRVLANLLSNACQAMPEGGRLTVTAELPPIPGSESAIFISIRDTGAGIASENIDKLFEPLFTTRPKGIGLGLAISKKLVEANSGQITVESQLGKGTVFTLNFPAYSAER